MSTFKELNVSDSTLKGLEENGLTEPTKIQSLVIPSAIKGEDILGAARTGSGKTLAFLIPILERLVELKWAKMYGIGVLIITPTRELAYQIFEVLRKIGKHHSFSAGLVIGGKDLKFEWDKMNNMNIVICTPGRLLQHLDQNPAFDCSNVQMLVLDEADRILDMGFAEQMNAIIDHLPKKRQTLLFSATQTRSVKDLARLSLINPTFVSADEFVTPENLKQSYIVLNLEDKLNFLWSFIKFHRQHKTLVFMSCCKEVRFFYEILCHLRPGVSVMALYGKKHQLKRMETYDQFYRKQHAVLLATDIAARGLDFPAIDFVLQLDCPDNVTQYIHRSGRTARYNKNGSATLVLTPPEEKHFIPELEAKKIPIAKLEPNPKFLQPIQGQLQSVLARFPELKECAVRCFKTYLKSVWLTRKEDVLGVNLEAFGTSLGLHAIPRVRFIERHLRENDPNVPAKGSGPTGKETALKKSAGGLHVSDEDSDDEEEILVPKKQHEIKKEEKEEEGLELPKPSRVKSVTKSAVAKKIIKKGILPNTRIKFDEDGNVAELDGPAGKIVPGDIEGLNIDEAKERMAQVDKEDKKAYRQRIKEKHKLERGKKKALKRKPGQEPRGFGDADEFGAVLGDSDDEDGNGDFRGGFPVDEEDYDGDREHVRLSSPTEEAGSFEKPTKKRKHKDRKPVINHDSEDLLEEEMRPSASGQKPKRLKVGEPSRSADFDGSTINMDEDLALKLLLT